MTTAFPGAIDALPRPGESTYTDDSGYELDLVIDNISDAIEATQGKVGSGSTAPARGKALTASGTGTSVWDATARKNLLINGDFRVWQRGTSPSPADNGYGADRWRTLLEAASAATTVQETADLPSDGGSSGVRMVVGSGEDNKFGVWQVLEFADIKHLRGKQVSLQAKLKATAAITDVRMAVVEWSSTADSVAADPINTWGTGGAGITNFSGFWSFANLPANLNPTTSWATYRIEGISISASANNLAVFIWCEDETTTVTTDILRITDVQLEEGAVCTDFERRPMSLEKTLCRFYFRRFGGVANAPITNGGWCTSTTQALVPLQYEPMRASPTFSFAAAGTYTLSGTTSAVLTSISASNPSPECVVLVAGYAAGPAAGQAAYLQATNTSGVIDASAEL